MRRHLPILILCFLLGLVTTIAVAWACAAWMNPSLARVEFDHHRREDGSAEVLVVQQAFGHTRINRAVCSELLLDEDTGNILRARWGSSGEERSESLAGWPLRAMRCTNHAEVSIVTGSSAMRIVKSGLGAVPDGWSLEDFSGGVLATTWRAVPLRPIVPGLLLDAVCFGAAWLLILRGFTAWRGRRRRSRGACPRCGYDLRSGGIEHGRCPECGAPPTIAHPGDANVLPAPSDATPSDGVGQSR